MGLFIIGEIQSEEIKDLIIKYFGGFKNTEEAINPDYKVPDFKENLFFSYQDALEENIQFAIWNKNEFKKVNNIENYRHAIVGYLVQDIYYRRIKELNEMNKSAFRNSFIYEDQI